MSDTHAVDPGEEEAELDSGLTERSKKWFQIPWFKKRPRLRAGVVVGVIGIAATVISCMLTAPGGAPGPATVTPPATQPKPKPLGPVTILVPLQGERAREEGEAASSNHEYEDKISQDMVQIIPSAQKEFARREREKGNRAKASSAEAVTFKLYPEGRDPVERRSQARAHIEQALTENRPVVAVIGHTSSQATQEAMPIYAEYDVPILMPYATQTGIAKQLTDPPHGAGGGDLKDEGVPLAVALVPSNRAQAKAICMFLRAVEARSVALFLDAGNLAYSRDLARELKRLLDAAPEAAPVAASSVQDRPVVVCTSLVGRDHERWYVDTALATAQPSIDAAVIVSMTDPAVEVLRQAERTGFRPKYVILSDGVVDKDLVMRLGSTLNVFSSDTPSPSPLAPGVLISFPEETVVPDGYESIFSEVGSSGHRVYGLSHAAYLTDAVFFALHAAHEVEFAPGAHVAHTDRVAEYQEALRIVLNMDDSPATPAFTRYPLFTPSRRYRFQRDGSSLGPGPNAASYTMFRLVPGTSHRDFDDQYEAVPRELIEQQSCR